MNRGNDRHHRIGWQVKRLKACEKRHNLRNFYLSALGLADALNGGYVANETCQNTHAR
jgi:hypothetical protein